MLIQVMEELGQYDSTDDRGCGYPGPMVVDRRRRKRSFCGWYWPSFSGGNSAKEVFDVSGAIELDYCYYY